MRLCGGSKDSINHPPAEKGNSHHPASLSFTGATLIVPDNVWLKTCLVHHDDKWTGYDHGAAGCGTGVSIVWTRSKLGAKGAHTATKTSTSL